MCVPEHRYIYVTAYFHRVQVLDSLELEFQEVMNCTRYVLKIK